MSQFNCPHCNKKGITLWAKMWLGSGVLKTCTCCDKKESVSNKATFAIIPMLFSVLMAQKSDMVLVTSIFFMSGLLVSIVIHIKMTSLVMK